MQYLSKDFIRKLSENLKVGLYSKPRCIVEIDRMAFIPGKIDQLTIEDYGVNTEVEIQREWIEADESGLFDGETVINSENIVFPVQGMSIEDITDGFGSPRNGGSSHQGVDIALNDKAYPERRGVGTPILAAWGGKVSTVRKSDLYSGYGIYVDIIHPNGLRTRYAHLNNALVSVGDIVSPGQVIGEGGNTGDVYSNGQPVLGSYSDVTSMRYKGYGAHLHFEIHEPVDNRGNFRAVDPMPYLKGIKKATVSISQKGSGVVKGNPLKGYEDTVRLNETFIKRNWYENPMYTFKNNFLELSTIDKTSLDGINNWNMITFPSKPGNPIITGFNIKVKMLKEGYMNFTFRSNFSSADGDEFYICIDDSSKRIVNYKNFKDFSEIQELKKIYLPAGDLDIDITIKWGGKTKKENGKDVPKKFAIGNIRIAEVAPTKEALDYLYGIKGYSNKQEDFTKMQGGGYWEEREIIDFVFTDQSKTFDLSVGEFVYVDTIRLENVESCDIALSLEQESAEAVVTITNPNGFYSPDYNPYYFPELFEPSPFSYFNGGFQIGVLSNNTPIRIYMGYGEEVIRVFTGLIDKIDERDNPPVLVITARDMYKKISDKVLTVTKQYPAVDLIDDFPSGTPETDNNFINSVLPGAIEAYQKYGILPSIVIAQAILESGWGVKKIGNNIFGIKATGDWNGKTQTKVTREYRNGRWVSETAVFRDYDSISDSIEDYAKLIGTSSRYEAVRNAKDYKEAANALQQAGYATDPEYAKKLINIIEQNNLDKFDTGQLDTVNYNAGFSGDKVAWLKSAVVQDLIAHAGMFGWRRNPEDLLYPDAVIEESYLISVNQEKGTYVRAVPGKEGEFEIVSLESVPTPRGWMNPYTEEYGKTFPQYKYRVGECINEVLKDTHYRAYCDRYGTFRLETINYTKPIVDTYTYRENLISVDKTIDFSRARSHIIVIDEEGNMASFLDKEILMELKSEVRTASVVVPWAKSYELKKVVASRLFEDMKRICRTLQVATPCNPTLDLLDRIRVIDKDTATNAVFTIKGIRRSYNADSGLVQFLELFWSEKGTVI